MTTHTTGDTRTNAGRREWMGLAVLALPTLLLSLDMSVLYLALPHLAADLAPSSSQLLWIMDGYGFMVAGFLVTMGTLGDRIGRRRLLLIGATAFGIASVAAAYATSAEMLIVTRFLLGIAGATLMPSTLALISNMFTNPKQRATAIAVWMSCFMGGTVIGPVIGGVMLEWFWWGSVFLLGVPVMVLLLVTAPALLPEYKDDNAGRIDLTSVVLALGTVLPVVYGLKEVANEDVEVLALLAIAIGGAVGVVFVRRQLRLNDPLLDLRLFANGEFGTALVTMMIGGFFMGGTFLLISQFLQLVGELSPLEAGLWLVPPSIGMIVATNLAPRLAARWGAWPIIVGGMAIAAVGIGLLTQLAASGSLVLAPVGMLIAMVGLGPGSALVTEIVLSSAPPERAGSAASLSETGGELGISMGVALLGSLAGLAYRLNLDVPPGTPEDLAGAMNDGLPATVAAAGTMSPDAAAPLVEMAQRSFTSGLNLVAAIGAIGIFVLVVVLVNALRKGRITEPAAAPLEPESTP